MKQLARRCLALVLSSALITCAQGNTFNKVRYNGGTVSTKIDPKDWDNQLTVTSDLIDFKLKDGQKIDILTKSVTSLSYGQEAHRRVGTMVALGILVAPLALFGLFHKTRLHFIAVEYTTADSKKSALLLQGDKDNYRAILVALKGATDAPLYVSEKDREYVPVGVEATVSKGEDTQSAKSVLSTGTVTVTSTPDSAEIYADGAFVGNATAALKLSAGKHTIRAVMPGYKEWSKEISVQAGSELKLAAVLEKQN
jgi:hypothetical protein